MKKSGIKVKGKRTFLQRHKRKKESILWNYRRNYSKPECQEVRLKIPSIKFMKYKLIENNNQKTKNNRFNSELHRCMKHQ